MDSGAVVVAIIATSDWSSIWFPKIVNGPPILCWQQTCRDVDGWASDMSAFNDTNRRKNPPMASPSSSSAWTQHVVSADDLLAARRPQQWVQVAARVFPELGTVSKAKRARKAGTLLLNGQSQVPTLTCAALNDVLALRSAGNQTQQFTGDEVQDKGSRAWLQVCETQGLRVVFECDTLAVVVKPVGIHVKGRGKRTVEQALPLLLQRQGSVADGDFLLPVPHAVHRLDYRVGGLLLVAKTRKMEVELSAQMERHTVTKQYRAILVGNLRDTVTDAARSRDVIDSIALPQALDEIQDELQFLDDRIDGKQCRTAVRLVSTTRSARYGWISTVDLWPLTGRKHQLRIHTARHGHPIVGDDLYHDTSNLNNKTAGHDESEQQQPEVVRGMGLFLYSVGVAFNDAVGNRFSFRIDEPNKFARFRHFCNLNWTKQAERRDRENNHKQGLTEKIIGASL
ncbi:unnamed protein product [Phytophthora fragariaefolia]|uniref:Unnamed protein product n=1 Tax=Phytophthora fragariaefolia TaxID=1490495 RepID=A0A9W6XPS9_9STRA|nr:unnamed protein product [Phytophthora fragariaefolia]